MNHKIDYAQKQFEVRFLKEFSALTKFSQTTALSVARQYAEDVLILFNDGYSPVETAKYLCGLIDIEEIKRSQFSLGVGVRWR